MLVLATLLMAQPMALWRSDVASARNRYRQILAIEVVRDDWLTADEASGLIGREGHIYRPIAK